MRTRLEGSTEIEEFEGALRARCEKGRPSQSCALAFGSSSQPLC